MTSKLLQSRLISGFHETSWSAGIPRMWHYAPGLYCSRTRSPSARRAHKLRVYKGKPLQPGKSNSRWRDDFHIVALLPNALRVTDTEVVVAFCNYLLEELEFGYIFVGTISPTFHIEEAYGYYDTRVAMPLELNLNGKATSLSHQGGHMLISSPVPSVAGIFPTRASAILDQR
jgi:hypothetical protein